MGNSYFEKLIRELRRLCEEKRSGTLFITTEENHAARFVIQNGLISGITYRTKHGSSAIPFIKNITGGTYTFASNRIFLSYTESNAALLPSTPEIFRLLDVTVETPTRLTSSPSVVSPPPSVSPRPIASPPSPISPQPTVSPTAVVQTVKTVSSAPLAPAKKILVVEDSTITRKLIVKTLLEGGYTVVEAENGLAAFARLSEENPDLMLLDIVMPGIDGYKVLSMVRKHDAFKNLPVIMLTSRDSLLDKLRGKMGGSDEYLTKPFTPDQLLEKINKYLSIR